MSADPREAMIALIAEGKLLGDYVPEVALSGEVMWIKPYSMTDDQVTRALTHTRIARSAFRMLNWARYEGYVVERYEA